MKKLVIAAALLCAAQPGSAEMKKVGAPIGKWQINSESDPMTDKLDCVAYYDNDNKIQLTEKSFAISYHGRGGVSSYTLRFDDESARPTQLASRIEKQISAFFIEGQEYDRLLKTKRLRVQTLTILSSIVNHDLDMTGTDEVVAKFKQLGCV